MIQGPVLVTGASKGIGRALAAALAARGIPVIGTSRDPKTVALPVPGVRYLTLDQGDDASIGALVEVTGPVEVLINNAGQSQIGPVEDVCVEAVEELFRMNFFGLIRLTKAYLPAMREKGRGTIINIGSLTGTFPPPFQSAYAATKLGLEAFTKTLRQEVAKRGVKVSLVIPGYIKTYIEPRMIASPDSVYEGEMTAFRLARDKKMDKASPAEMAAAKIIRVMEKKNPGPVYYTGRFVPAMGFLKRLLPEKTAQRMIRGFYHLDR
ncbi:MAG: SDR family NAD(P)-dependent oxidoreductase [Candidatus Aminicenantales bacterium]